MSRSTFEAALEARGFSREKSRPVVNLLIERQYSLAKSILLQCERSQERPSEESVAHAVSVLLPKRVSYTSKDREDMAAVNLQPLPEIKSLSGPAPEDQLKYVSVKKPLATTSSAVAPAKPALLEVDDGPQDDTIFRSSKSSQGAVEFRGGEAEAAESKKRSAEVLESEEERKRMRI